MKVSDFFGKRILSTAGREGYVIGMCADERSLFLICADSDEREFAVDMQCVLSHKESIIFNGSTAQPRAARPIRLGRAGFDMNGRYLGNLEDITLSGGRPKTAKIGKKNYPAEALISGDVILVKDLPRLSAPVTKGKRTLFKKGTFVTQELLNEAAAEGEYVQTKLKSI